MISTRNALKLFIDIFKFNNVGLSKNISGKDYLVNPDKIFQILFEEIEDENILCELTSEATLMKIIEQYESENVSLTIPKHYYFSTKDEDVLSQYNNKINLISLTEFI